MKTYFSQIVSLLGLAGLVGAGLIVPDGTAAKTEETIPTADCCMPPPPNCYPGDPCGDCG